MKMFNINKKTNKYLIGYLITSIFLFTFIFRDLILNISTNLIDWRDYSYVVWVINQGINNLKGLPIDGLFNGNAFYPLKGIMLFSDLLWPQALIALFFSLFTSNIILQFNLVFLTTLALNTISVYLFWKTIFKKNNSVLFASLLTNFSPFFFLQLSHFQMISYWPTFFALSFLFKKKRVIKDSALIGLFLSIQFYTSVYWSIFLLTILGIYFLIKLIKKKLTTKDSGSIVIIGTVFLILTGPILFKYIQIKKLYNLNRNYSEYVSYSAQISDYFFNNSYSSLISSSKIFKKINSFNNHSTGEIAGSPTIVVAFLSLIGAITIKNNRKELFFSISTKNKDLFFLILTLTGLILSLGPRLSFNGSYLSFPLPFHIALKYLVVFDPIRAIARISALFYIGAFYFATKGLKKINQKIRNKKIKTALLILFSLFYFLEIIPLNLKSEYNDYYSDSYKFIEKDCSKKAILLEYPFNQNFKNASVTTNLKYKASQLSASINHNCNLVNGYAGFDPQEYSDYIFKFNNAILATDSAKLNHLINQKEVNIIKINKESLSHDKLKQLNNIGIQNNFGQTILEDDKYLILKTGKTKNE